MEFDLQNLDLIDLLSERHLELRQIVEDLWNDNSEIYLSTSEWFIMARIYKKKPTIAYVTKHVNISRQATHKFVKSLEAKGLVEISNVPNNKRDKCIQLTKLGEACYEKNKQHKINVEKKIADQIGTEKVQLLKNILKLDWGLE